MVHGTRVDVAATLMAGGFSGVAYRVITANGGNRNSVGWDILDRGCFSLDNVLPS
jgi:hypothetical protein